MPVLLLMMLLGSLRKCASTWQQAGSADFKLDGSRVSYADRRLAVSCIADGSKILSTADKRPGRNLCEACHRTFHAQRLCQLIERQL